MKYVLLGNLSSEWASKQSERIGKAKAKLDKLGIKIESVHYTQGYYDFVDIVDAPDQEAMLAFSVWYATPGSGADPKYAGLRRKELRSRDQGRGELSAGKITIIAATNDRALALSARIAGGMTRVGAAEKATIKQLRVRSTVIAYALRGRAGSTARWHSGAYR